MQAAFGDREPGYVMIQRWLIGPSFARRELHVQVVNARGRKNWALGVTIGSQDDPRGLFLGHVVGGQVMALAGGVLEFLRQGDPQLKALRLFQSGSRMPDAAAGAHEFDPIRGQNPLYAGGFLILNCACMKHRDSRDARMRMPAEVGRRRRGNIKKIQEHERLDELAEIRRAHQAGDRSVPLSSGPKRNAARRVARFQYRAHAASAAMLARAFNMAASLASGPKASPSARTMVTSVSPIKESTPVR